MKSALYCLLLFVGLGCSFFLGCEFDFTSTAPPPIPSASTLIINEVFTLPLSNQSTFSWIEFYNPTNDTVNLYHDWRLTFNSNDTVLTNAPRWTVTLATNGYEVLDTAFVVVDSTGQEIGRFTSGVNIQRRIIQNFGYGVFEVPFGTASTGNIFPGIIGTGFRIPPGELFTFVNNNQRLEDHTRWGNADGALRLEPFFFSAINTVDTIRTIYIQSSQNTDSLAIRLFRITFRLYTIDLSQPTVFSLPFFIPPKEQLVLRNQSGTIVDVVRMGDSVYTNVMGDSSRPMLSIQNRSVGSVPEYESIARFARAYFTENTANDFYITRRPSPVPTPHWYNPLPK
jgi:hypothetical protein